MYIDYAHFQTNNTNSEARIDTPRFSITSIDSVNIRHKKDTLVLNNIEYAVSDHFSTNEKLFKKKGK